MSENNYRTILVVDDDQMMRAFYIAALKRHPYKVLTAENGSSALEIIKATSIDCLVIDSHMPYMTGPEVIERLRSQPEYSLLPIIIVTGSDELAARISGLDLGANDYLVKPVDPEELVARIRAQLRINSSWLAATRSLLEQRIALIDALNQVDPSSELKDQAQLIIERLKALEEVRQVALYAFSSHKVSVLLAGEANHPVNSDNEVPRNVDQVLRALAQRGPTVLTSGVDERWWSNSNSDHVFASPIGNREEALGVLVMAGRSGVQGESAGMSLSIDAANIVGSLLSPELRRFAGRQFSAEEIRRSLKMPTTYIAYQPIVDLEAKKVVGYEALARFGDGVRPDHRLSQARSLGILDEIELELVEMALASSSQLPADVWLSVNLSAAVLVSHPELSDITGSAGRQIVLEITEHEPINDYSLVRSAIASLMGEPQLSVDDAGAGYASLRHIFELSPSYVKLDREWVTGIESDPIRQSLVNAMVTFSKKSGAKLIAEGIETIAELETLIAVGVNFGQGYLFGMPTKVPGDSSDQILSRLGSTLNWLN